jgi:thioredoxin reductase
MLQRAKTNPKIIVMTNTTIQSWLGSNEVLSGAIFKNGSSTFELFFEGAFIAIGHQPNTKFLDKQV